MSSINLGIPIDMVLTSCRAVTIGLVFSLTIIMGTSADLGDTLYVQKDGVNVRSGPNAERPVVMQLNQGHKLLEFGREGAWVNVGIEQSGGRDGWIHISLVGAVSPGGGSVAPFDPKFDRFNEAVTLLNRRAKDRTGFDFFIIVENLGDGIVQITATDAWLSAPRADREGNLDTLFNLWDAADGSGLPIMVRIVDGDGELRMEKSRR